VLRKRLPPRGSQQERNHARGSGLAGPEPAMGMAGAAPQGRAVTRCPPDGRFARASAGSRRGEGASPWASPPRLS
jgi:hypothetical protein